MIGASRGASSGVSVDWADLFLRFRAAGAVLVLTVCVLAVVRLWGGFRLRAMRKGVAR